MKQKKVLLTGDRPTGRLHLGHYIGSLKTRVEMQNSGEYEPFIMIADVQALTDNAQNPGKVRENLREVVLDYLSVGIDPEKSTIFVQSAVPALFELTTYYMNLINLGRLQRNPTIKTEIKERGFREGVPIGFLNYPVSQAADITAFRGEVVPVGADQIPVIEITNEIVRRFNHLYGEILVTPTPVVPEGIARRLPGLDGDGKKMSKSLQNTIYLSDTPEEVERKVMSAYTDPEHVRVEDPGKIEGNVVFAYLTAFAPDDPKVEEMKAQYEKGGLGDVVVKKYLVTVLETLLAPIREKRHYYETHPELIDQILREGNQKANARANETLAEVRKAIGVDYG